MFLEGGSAPQLTPLTAAKGGILDTFTSLQVRL